MMCSGRGAGVPFVSATWNPLDKATDIGLSNGDMDAANTSATNGHDLVRATHGKSSGSWYFEATTAAVKGTGNAGDGILIGVVLSSQTLAGTFPGSSTGIGVQYRRQGTSDGVAYYSGGTLFTQGQYAVAGAGYCGIAFKPGVGVWAIVDGNWLSGKSPKSHPASPLVTLAANTYFPAASSYYTLSSKPDAIQTLKTSGFLIGAGAFAAGAALEGFTPYYGDPI